MKLLAWFAGVPWGLIAYLAACVVAAGVAIYFRQWRILWWAIVAAVIGYSWHTLGQWKAAYDRLPEVEAALAAEIACAVDTECHKRAATLAEQARQEAALKAQDALQAAEKAEAAARANAAAWRKRYEAALANDPGCQEWASRPIACPVN